MVRRARRRRLPAGVGREVGQGRVRTHLEVVGGGCGFGTAEDGAGGTPAVGNPPELAIWRRRCNVEGMGGGVEL